MINDIAGVTLAWVTCEVRRYGACEALSLLVWKLLY